MTRLERRFLAPHPAFVLDQAAAPSFSVVIPAYNAAPFIAEAIESALRQTLPPHQLIVSDDGSTDDLERALAPFGSQLTYVRGEHAGPAAARNRALRAATGDFVAALDADDAYLPDRLAALQELARGRPDLDILSTDAALEVEGTVVGRFNLSTPFPVLDQRKEILRTCFVCAPAIRRSRLLAVGGYDERLLAGEDWDAVLRLILAGCPAGLVDEPLYTYRLRPGSVTSHRLSGLQSRTQLLEKAKGHPGLSPDEAQALERSLGSNRRRLLRARAEVALIDRTPDRRRRSFELATAPGVAPRERVQAIAWTVRPSRAGRAFAGDSAPALESAAPWRRARR